MRKKVVTPFSVLVLVLCIGTAPGQSPPPTGLISLHLWNGVGGTAVADLTGLSAFPDSPNVAATAANFHAPTNIADNYGTRMFGWVHAPVTADYTFWIHSDDNSELWLSSDPYPENKILIARIDAWTNDGEWNKYSSQQSATIPLVAGQFYFIEALQKEGGGGDNLGVAWSYPGQSRTYIPGSALSEWQNLGPVAADDQAVLGIAGTVLVDVLANDTDLNGNSDLDPTSLQVTTPPANGTFEIVGNGRIRYTHTGSTSGSNQFTYTISDEAGLSDTATVTLTISAAGRLPNTTLNVPAEPPATEIEIDPAWALQFSQPLGIVSAPGDTQRLWILEKTGDIEIIPDIHAATPTHATFLDLDTILSSRGDSLPTTSEQGLLGLAFHPDYSTNGYFFTVYSVRTGGSNYQRLARWTDPDPTDNTAANAIEEILIQQLNQASNHNGGDLHFGPDGYLYMSWGDEGGQNDSLNNSQFISKDFWSSFIRIDVDLESEDYTAQDGSGSDDANLPPNGHPAIVLHNGSPLYEVPADNHWVNANSFNGVPVTDSDVRTEFFAVGFRNPWRFSFDPVTGDLWVGDVGQGAREEVTRVALGSNHGWAWREGFIAGSKSGQAINGAIEANATLTDPDWDYTRGSGTFQGRSVTGGVVYRGASIPNLYGKYIFGDYVSGNIWSLELTQTPGAPVVERIGGLGGVVAFGTDPSNGDVLLANINTGTIYRLVAGNDIGDFPQTLAETGVFADHLNLIPNPGIVPYEINLPFWSDHAIKSRWFSVPDLADQFTLETNAPWTFPTGTVWIKHFDMLADESDPNSAFKIETRLLVKNDTGVYGVTYRWNEEQTQAVLVASSGDTRDFNVTTASGIRAQQWIYPSRASCLSCHNPAAGGALSFNVRQLNCDAHINGQTQNVLSYLSDAGYVDGPLPDQPSYLPRHVAPDESMYSLEARARSYLAVNCAYCHQPGGGGGDGTWDLRPHLRLQDTQVINGAAIRALHPDDRLIVPGDTTRSVILSRTAATNGYTRMPPIASNTVDDAGAELIRQWIENEVDNLPTYEEWRQDQFGNTTSPEGEPGIDADGDGCSNRKEWVTRTNPNDPNSKWSPTITVTPASVTISYQGLNRATPTIKRSTDLVEWHTWDVPGNSESTKIPLNPAQLHDFEGTAEATAEFFRIELEER